MQTNILLIKSKVNISLSCIQFPLPSKEAIGKGMAVHRPLEMSRLSVLLVAFSTNLNVQTAMKNSVPLLSLEQAASQLVILKIHFQ